MGDGMFKKGDVVCLNELGRSVQALGNKDYAPNPCSQKLLAGEALEVSDIQPVFDGSQHFSLRFCDGAYSFSQDYFKLAS